MSASDDLERLTAKAVKKHGERLIAESAKRAAELASVRGLRGPTRVHGAFVAVAALAVLVLGFRFGLGPTLVGSSPSPSISTTAAATQTAEAIASSPTVAPTRAAPTPTPLSPCKVANLQARAGREGENGVVNIQVEFTNAGLNRCSLPGLPTEIKLLRADGKPLNLTVEPPVGAAGQVVILPPSGVPSAVLIAYWSNWCLSEPGGIRVAVMFGGQPGTVVVPLSGTLLPRCDDPGGPSKIQVDSVVSE